MAARQERLCGVYISLWTYRLISYLYQFTQSLPYWHIELRLEKSKITDIGVQSMSGRRIVIHARWERMTWRNWYDERWEGWNCGKGMHVVKRSWSGTAIVPRDNESNSHNHRIHVATVQRNFCYSQCKHKDILHFLWMNYFQCTEKVDGYPLDCKFTFKRLDTFVTLTSGIWELSIKFYCHSRWHVSKWVLCTEKTIAIRSMYRGIFTYRDVPVF